MYWVWFITQALEPKQSSEWSCLLPERQICSCSKSNLWRELVCTTPFQVFWGRLVTDLVTGSHAAEHRRNLPCAFYAKTKKVLIEIGDERDGSTGYSPRGCHLLCSGMCKDLSFTLFPIKGFWHFTRLCPLRNFLICLFWWHFLMFCFTFSWTLWNTFSLSFLLLLLSASDTRSYRHKLWALYMQNTFKVS